MSEVFPLALQFALKWEGGDKYTNDPVDPGGETKYGISKRAYPDIDIKSLTLQEASLIYERDYWDKAGCPSMEKSQAIVMFDAAVNCGVGRAKSWLKEVDPEVTDDKRRARWLIQRRIAYYNDLVKRKPALSKYSKGWLNRVTDLSRYIDIV
jgi:lysozyme family protein